jgi:hypothetical protein
MPRYRLRFKAIYTITPTAPTTAPTPRAYIISGQPVARDPAAPAAVVCTNWFPVVAVAVVAAPDAAGNRAQVVNSKL